MRSFKRLIQQKLPFVLFVLLAAVTLLLADDRVYLLPALFLLLPFIDKDWSVPLLEKYRKRWLFWSASAICIGILALLNPQYSETILIVLIFTALPEEWFFRSYFLQRLEVLYEGKWTANVITSLLFALLHTPVQGWQGVTVFVPSILFGWMYQRNRDLLLVILVHTLFNGMYIIYLRDMLNFI